MTKDVSKYDLFISHASEDKDAFVRPLAEELRYLGFQVWYDEFCITAGESIFESINDGLTLSKVGVVVLSKNFFRKSWVNSELKALFNMQMNNRSLVIPIWHEITKNDVLNNYPLLLDVSSINSAPGAKKVAAELARATHMSNLGMHGLVKYKEKLGEKNKNRQFLEEVFSMRAALKGGRHKASVAIIDIDDMTKINKIYGEQVGDNVLLLSELLINEQLDGFECEVGRCGDDTFYSALYATPQKLAFDRFVGICEKVKTYSWHKEADKLRVSVSVGYAGFNYDDEQGLDVAIRAAIGMKAAKENGGDQAESGPYRLSHASSKDLFHYFS